MSFSEYVAGVPPSAAGGRRAAADADGGREAAGRRRRPPSGGAPTSGRWRRVTATTTGAPHACCDLLADRRFAAEHHRALDQVLELAHVARPVVLHEQTPSCRATARCSGLLYRTEYFFRKWSVSTGISSRRSRSGGRLMRHDVQPEVEVFAELAVGDRLEIAVGRGDARARRRARRACRRAARTRRPAAPAAAWPAAEAHVADLVEEHRAVIGELELARLVLDRAGEGAALEPEQLRFEQLGRQRGAVHFDERLVAPQRGGRAAPARQAPCRCRFRRESAPSRRCRRPARSDRALRPSARCGRRASDCSTVRLQLVRSVATSCCSWRCWSACASGTSRSASSNGLLTKSVAPSFIACTTVAVRPWPDSTMTGTSRSIFLNAASASSPSMPPGMTTSRITAAGRSA